MAESHRFMREWSQMAKEINGGGTGLNVFTHYRHQANADMDIPRPNKDVLYSHAVIDLAAGPVQITLPQVDDRYFSICCVDEFEYISAYHTAPVVFKLNQDFLDSRYQVCVLRLAIKYPAEVKDLHAIQNQVEIISPIDPDHLPELDVPEYDLDILNQHRELLLQMSFHATDFSYAYGFRHEVDPIAHMIGAAAGWSGLSKNLAKYETVEVNENDGEAEYILTIKGEVPTNCFWSITVYNKKGRLIKGEKNYLNSYNVNVNQDGDVVVMFTKNKLDDVKDINVLNIEAEWNYLVRIYEPKKEVTNGNWVFPEAVIFKS